MSSSAASTRQARPGRGVRVVEALADLTGPDHGTVELPLVLFWSGPDRGFDLDERSALLDMYETVLREASQTEQLTTYLNKALLVAAWPELYLPRAVRAAWEERHPRLRQAGTASPVSTSPAA